MIPLTNEESKCFSNKKFVIYSKKNLVPMMTVKSTIKFETKKEITVVFHNISKYGHYFIINKSAEKFEGQFESLGENTEKYITFSVPIDKELEND